MFSKAPVAFLCTRISLDFARRVRGPSAPDRAILALLSSCVAKLVIQPTALHCTSTFGDIICRMRGVRPPRSTIATLFSAKAHVSLVRAEKGVGLTINCQIPKSCASCSLHLDIGALQQEQYGFEGISIYFTDI